MTTPEKKTACLVLRFTDDKEFANALARALDDGWVQMHMAITSVTDFSVLRELTGGASHDVTTYHAIMQRWEDA